MRTEGAGLKSPALVAVGAVLCAASALIPLAAGAAAPPLARGSSETAAWSYDGAFDLQALWRDACAAGWQDEDAVVLLDRRQLLEKEGTWVEFRHRVVRLATDLVIEGYADLRVPYDTTRGDLTVQSLRTLRDGRWIESGPSAQVETTPSALDRAVAYWGWRERMLLHDGVELPCVVETAWTITRRPSQVDDGSGGTHLYPASDPVVRAEILVLGEGGDSTPYRTRALGGAPEPVLGDAGTLARAGFTASGPTGTEARGFGAAMTRVDPIGERGPDPAASLPGVAWSRLTWPELGRALDHGFTASVQFDGVADAALLDTLRARLRDVAVPSEIARRVAALVSDRTRFVDYAPPLHLEVRPAAEVYASGYALAWERASLAAALLRSAGLEARLVLTGRSYAAITGDDLPGLERFGAPQIGVFTCGGSARDATDPAPRAAVEAIGISGSGPLVGLYDPETSTFHPGAGSIAGRSVWWPGIEDHPRARGIDDAGRLGGRVALGLDLRRDEKDGAWIGTGVYEAEGALTPFGSMEGLSEQASTWLGAVVSGVLAGAEVESYNLSRFDVAQVVGGVTVRIPSPKADSSGRTRLEIGAPAGGVSSVLSEELHLHRAERETPLFLPGSVRQELTIRLRLPDGEVVRLPDPIRLENQTGRFTVEVSREGEIVRLFRALELTTARVEPEAWPELRALLLAEENARYRVVLYRAGEAGDSASAPTP